MKPVELRFSGNHSSLSVGGNEKCIRGMQCHVYVTAGVSRLSPRDEITVNDADDEVGRLGREFTELRTLLPTWGRLQRGNVQIVLQSTELEKRVELYLYSTSGPSCPVTG